MPELKFVLAGNQTDAAATALVSALGPEGNEARREKVTEIPDADRKIIDPLSLAALIVSIPSAVPSVMDIADRLTKPARGKRSSGAVARNPAGGLGLSFSEG
jgi:hypothetical protein